MLVGAAELRRPCLYADLLLISLRRWIRMHHFVSHKQWQPFSPLWGAYILSTMRYRRYGHEWGPPPTAEEGSVEHAKMHPFNFSDEVVNRYRARHFFALLDAIRRRVGYRRSTARPAWWPRSSRALLEMIKKEREDIESIGYIVGGAFTREKTTIGAAAGSTKYEGASEKTSLERQHTHTE